MAKVVLSLTIATAVIRFIQLALMVGLSLASATGSPGVYHDFLVWERRFLPLSKLLRILLSRPSCITRTSQSLRLLLSARSFGQGVRHPDVASTGAMRPGIIARGIHGSLTGLDTGILWGLGKRMNNLNYIICYLVMLCLGWLLL